MIIQEIIGHLGMTRTVLDNAHDPNLEKTIQAVDEAIAILSAQSLGVNISKLAEEWKEGKTE